MSNLARFLSFFLVRNFFLWFYRLTNHANHEIMDNAFRMLSDLVSNLTSVIIGILGLGIVGSLAFGDMMGLNVIGNITSLVESLASGGVVGLY